MTLFTLSVLLSANMFSVVPQKPILIDSLKHKELQEITVYSSFNGNLALPMVEIDKKAIDATIFFTPADALQKLPGITLSKDGMWATSLNIRGLSEQRLIFMVDGDRVLTATDISGALSTIDMDGLDKIEVIKGASSVLYGSGAMGGVVNFVTSRPNYTDQFETSGSVSSGFNTVNKLFANNANVQFTTNQWYLKLTGSFRTAQDTYTPQGNVNGSQFHDASYGLLAGIKYAPNEEFLVNYQHFGAWDVGIPGSSAFPATASVRYKSFERNQLSGEYIISDIGDYLREIHLKAYTQTLTRDVENKVNASTTILPGSVNTTWGAKGTTDWQFGSEHSLILGAESWVRNSATNRQKIITISDSEFNVIGEEPTPDAKMWDTGVYSHYSWKIIPSKVTVNAGLRLDYIRTQNDSAFNPIFKYNEKNGVRTDVQNLPQTLLFESSTHNELSYAAHFDVVYMVASGQQLSLSVANSYRVASIEERFKYIDQGAALPLRVGSPDLKPERGTFSNLSYSFFNSNLKLKADVFANYLFDLITEESGTYLSRPALINTNIDKALLLGAELEAGWAVNKKIKVDANASYVRGKNMETKTYLPQIPPLSGLITFNYKVNDDFEGSLAAEWAARQDEAAANEKATDGHLIFNLDMHTAKIHYLNSYIQFYSGIQNVLNTSYYNHLTSARNNGELYAEPGRNIYIKVKWGW